ncbi:MAG: hypothetical protein ACK5V3_06360 [Bdellovibrionales bacterium]
MLTLTFVNADAFRDYYRTAVGKNSVSDKRSPASLPNPSEVVPSFDMKNSMIEINCGRKLAQEMRVNSPWAQIKGRYCKPSKGKVVEVINKSNGFTASLFEFGQEVYKTDLIQLNQGANEIQIRSLLSNGLSEQQTIIVYSSSI